MQSHEHVHILAISGSLRARSYNTALLRAAADLLPPHTSLTIADLNPIPFYNGDVEAAGTPAPVLAFRAQMRAADALLFASPEYNYSVTGALKNALDWASRHVPDAAPLDGKTAALIGAGGRLGTIRSQLHLREILQHNDVHVLNRPNLLLARAGTFFDADLNLTDAPTRERLQALLVSLRDWTLALRRAGVLPAPVPA